MALNFKRAYNCFPNCPKWAAGGALLITKLLAQNKNKPILPGNKFVKGTSGPQKLAYDQFMSSHYNLDFITHLKERLDSRFDPHKLDWTSIHFENSMTALTG